MAANGQPCRSLPRVGGSRPVPRGTLQTAVVARAAGSLLACLRDAATTSQGSLSTTGDSPSGNWCHSRQRWLQGHPNDAQRWWGQRAQRTQLGPGAQRWVRERQRPKNRRLCRPPKRSEVPVFLMPFLFFPHVWSFSGRLRRFLLVFQRKVAPTTCFLPDHLWFLLVGGRVEVALVSAGFGPFASYRVLRCMAPGRKHCCNAASRGPTKEWHRVHAQKGDAVPVFISRTNRAL